MNTKQVTLVVTFQARPGKEAELRKTLLGLIPLTRKEEGCINYDLHVTPDDLAKFLFYENWTTEAHLNKHGETPHVQNLLKRMDELCVEPLKLNISGKKLSEFAGEFLNLFRRENFSFSLIFNQRKKIHCLSSSLGGSTRLFIFSPA